MATYGQAVDQILSELAKTETSITSFVQQELLQAVDFYSTTRFWFNETNIQFVTSLSSVYYPLGASGALEIDSVVITIGGIKYDLREENYAVLNELDLGNTFGQPTRYAWWMENVRLYPVPNASWTVDVSYQQRFATLSASGDSNAFLTHGLEMIKARVHKNLNAIRYDNPSKARAAEMIENNAYTRLILQTEKLLMTGKISPG